MNSQDPVRVGIVGCGYQGRLMAEAVTQTGVLRVTACADPVRDAAAGVAALAGGAEVFASADELLARGDVDAIIIATPHHVLQPIALAAMDAGKHVLAEKPIALNAGEAAEIEATAARAGVRYMAGYSLRFFVAQSQVHALLEAGTIGEIQAVTAGIGTGPLGGWFARAETGGGALLYLGSHLVDEVLWSVNDDPVQVYADVRLRSDTGTDETSVFQICFAGGAVAQCFVTQAVDGWFHWMNLFGQAGHIRCTSSNWLRFDIAVYSPSHPAYAEPVTIRPRLRGNPLMLMLVPEVEEFAAAIQENRPPSVTATDGRRVLQVLDAVLESGRAGRPVSVS